jgi:hypothetical protein
MDEAISAQDRTALLRQGIAVLDAEIADGRLTLEVSGAPDDRVRAAVVARFGSDANVTVVDDLPRRLYARTCVGHMEREPGRLQLRYVLWPGEHIGDILVVEDDRTVVVLGMICVPAAHEPGEPCEVPTHVYLDRPLGYRTVYDGCGGEAVHYKNVWVEIEARLANGRRATTTPDGG